MIVVARGLLDVLFASLWQGATIALAVAAAFIVTGHRLNAATRCIVLQGALVAIALVAIATTLPNIMPNASIQGGHGVPVSSAARIGAAVDLAAAARRIDVPLSDRAVLILTGAWIIGALTFTLRIGAGSLQLARLVRRSKRLADRGDVCVYASPDIGVPLAIGFAIPSVIVPTTLAAKAGEQFECIMLHELAHVRRGDAWLNACERALHALLFFNPAVMLVLRSIALEREAACDDWAVAQSRDLDTYTRSLASFAVWGIDANSVAACGASGFGRATLTRIRRLEDARRNGAIALSRYALGVFTLMLTVLALSFAAFAPAIAFAPQSSVVSAIVASTTCSQPARYLSGPPPHDPGAPYGIKTLVRLRISPAGKVESATVSKSSGNAGFDRAVVAAAKKGTFAPQVQSCKPVSGTYIFVAQTAL